MAIGKNKLKNIILGFLFIYCASAFCESALIGAWTAKEMSVGTNIPKALYTILLKQRPGGKISGSYCFILQSGRKIDCSDGDAINIRGISTSNDGSVTVAFIPFFGSGKGTARISLSSGNLIWDVLATPSGGEYFGPMRIVLDRAVEPLKEATVQVDRADLFDLPSDKSAPHGYLVRGDKVTIEDISDDARYWKIVFITKNGKSIRRWISCRDIGKCG